MSNDDHLRCSNVDLSTVCRICLSDEPCRPVLSEENPEMADVVYALFKVRISDNDKLSKMICEKCTKHTQLLCNRREMAKKNARELHLKIKKTYGDRVEEINHKLKLKKNAEPLVTIEKSKLDKPTLKKSKIDKPKVKKLKIEELQDTEEIQIDELVIKKPKIEKLKTVVPKIGFIPPKETIVKSEIGNLICQYCSDTYLDSVNAYIKHLSEVHNLCMEVKHKELRLCPLCDCNYENSVYRKHLEDCTNRMMLRDGSKVSFSCNICSVLYKNITGSQFRQHYMFCKSFQKIANKGSLHYKCNNCTFESSDLKLSTTHAYSTCLYLRMNLKYAKKPTESLELKTEKT